MPKTLIRFGRSVERLVGSDVHPGEWHLVLLFFLNLFLLLTAYYVLKVIREPLILMGGGAVSRSYARGLQAGLLFAVIPAYSWLANRVEPARLVKWIYGVFVVCLVAFYALGQVGVSIGFAFFVWLGIFSTLSIAQFWSLANDIMTESEGKRLFPIIAAGGTVGGILGAQITSSCCWPRGCSPRAWRSRTRATVPASATASGCRTVRRKRVTHGVASRCWWPTST